MHASRYGAASWHCRVRMGVPWWWCLLLFFSYDAFMRRYLALPMCRCSGYEPEEERGG